MPLQNPNATGIRVTTALLLLSLITPLLAQLLGSDPELWWVLGLVSALICLIILPILYFTGRRFLKEMEALVGGEYIVHWQLDQAEWQRYAASDWARARRYARQTALWTAGLGLGFSLLLGFTSGELVGVLLWVGGGCVLLGLLLGGLIWQLSRSTYDRRMATTGEVYVGPNGALNAGTYHPWAGFGIQLEAVRLGESDPAEVIFTIRTQAGKTTTTNDVHIPVPRGREEEAARLVASFYADET